MPNNKEHHPIFKQRLTTGQKAADIISNFCGSWTFIIIFLIFVIAWIILNIIMMIYNWDPYPFEFLNLFLALIATLEVPIILMSQNRQAERDRISAKYDYHINRKSEKKVEEMVKELREIKKLIKKK